MMNGFTSRLANHVKSFVEFQVAHGRDRKSCERKMCSFDRFCADNFPEEKTLTKEMALSWAERRGNESSGTQADRTGAVRGLGRYLSSMGFAAYVLPNRISPKIIRYESYVPTDDEIARLFAVADTIDLQPKRPFRKVVLPVLLRLIYTCGLRPGEGRRIKCKDVNLTTGELAIRKAKRNKERIVLLSDDMRIYLAQYDLVRRMWDLQSEYLFPGESGEAFDRDVLCGLFKKCWKLANPEVAPEDLARVRVYDLRHRFTSATLIRWLDEGRDINAMLPVLQAYLGHSSLAATAYYVHILPENLSKSTGINWDVLEGLVPEVEV